MTTSAAPVFGKRNRTHPAPTPSPARRDAVSEPPADQAAFFAAARDEFADTSAAKPKAVPRSFKAAFLAGVVVGCGLAGFNVTGSDGAARVDTVASALGLSVDTSGMLPMLILLGLVGGARIAALTVIAVNRLLNAMGQTSHAVYALGGAAASAVMAGLFLAVGRPPAHGWPIEIAAGAAAGLLYRVFAGAREAD